MSVRLVSARCRFDSGRRLWGGAANKQPRLERVVHSHARPKLHAFTVYCRVRPKTEALTREAAATEGTRV